MSRTDHHRPYRIRVQDEHEDRVEHHDHRPIYRFCVTQQVEREQTSYSWRTHEPHIYRWTERKGYRVGQPVDCDIEEFAPGPRWWTGRGRCYYSLADERPFRHVPKDVRREYWYAPDRREARDACRDLLRAYNAGEDIEDADPPTWQHRHSASWWYY